LPPNKNEPAKNQYLCTVISQRHLYLQHLAQTSPAPLALEIVHAEDVFLTDTSGKKYVDLIAGISVSSVGHRHPRVVDAIKSQADQYLHVMVYGEYILSPQVKLATKIASLLPASLNATYFTNSGAEATEGALKLAKRLTGRSELISFVNAYHGSTHGALSIMGNEYFKTAYRPLLPDTQLLQFNSFTDLEKITTRTACVVVEPIQGEAGAVVAADGFLTAIRKRCTETGTLLIFDEIQTGFGRTGKLFGFQHEHVIPDIVLFAKGIGGGMPIGAFTSSHENMLAFTENPVLGHITTFGGHPVSCAAALATINIIEEENLVAGVASREAIIRKHLVHPAILELRGRGLLLAAIFETAEINQRVIQACLKRGIITDWFLFCDNGLRIAPPLTIEENLLRDCCLKIVDAINEVVA
jgi:acetylornithine/succinyldiaminopimelate/putrescine aminotransferase